MVGLPVVVTGLALGEFVPDATGEFGSSISEIVGLPVTASGLEFGEETVGL